MESSAEEIVLRGLHDSDKVNQTQNIANKTSSLSRSSTSCSSLGNFCRICHDNDEPLIIACKCRGTVAYTHQRCLVEWLLRSGKPQCELCGADYILRVRNAHGWIKIFTQRISSHDKAMVLVSLICTLFLISTTAWLVWSAVSPENATQRANELFQTCYALYGFMDVFCLGILLHEIPHMRLLWKRLKLIRYEIYVLPHPSSKVVDITTNTEEIALNLSDSEDECVLTDCQLKINSVETPTGGPLADGNTDPTDNKNIFTIS